MSYILDALKKSDQERKRGDVPNLQTVHIPITVEQHTPWMLYGFISVLLIVLAFVIGVIIPTAEKDTVSEKQNQARIISDEIHLDKEKISSDRKLSPVLAQKTQVKPVDRSQFSKQKEIVVSDAEVVNPYLENEPVEIRREVVLVRQNEDKISAEQDIPYLHELPEYQQQSVPELNYAGHVYSSQPSSRSIIINGAAMSEGDTIVQGINVEEITQNGVVLSLHGQLFRMDILQDWSFD